MTLSAHVLAEGPGWSVADVLCTAGPEDRPFEEQHEQVCVAAVVSGTFQYRTRQGRVTLAPGALMLGNAGACFECSHEHGVGDRCLAMSPYHFLRTFRAVTGVTPYQFVLGQRFRQVAARLRQIADPIVDIVFETGFGDLATFNRRFRRIMAKTPSAWRAGR
jgi:hypothetical protein